MKERILHRLELQALDIEAIMSQHDLDAQVHGGYVDAGAVRFQVQGAASVDARTRDQLAHALREALGAEEVRLSGKDSTFDISLDACDRIDLLQLLESDIVLSAAMVSLGWSTDDRPLLLNLHDTISSHVAILGGPSAGKTALLRTYAISLAISSRQSVAQMVFIDPKCPRPEPDTGPGLRTLHYLPHSLSAVLVELEDIANGLAFLVDESAHRRAHGVRRPTIVVFIDNVDHLLQAGGSPIRDSLQQLLTSGSESGIQLVMAARPPQQNTADPFGDLLARKSVLRIVGRVADATHARKTTRLAQSGAEELLGRGDFIVAREEEFVRFQSAFVDMYDLHWCLESLQRRRPPALLAHATKAHPLSGAKGDDGAAIQFSFDGRRVSVSAPLKQQQQQVPVD